MKHWTLFLDYFLIKDCRHFMTTKVKAAMHLGSSSGMGKSSRSNAGCCGPFTGFMLHGSFWAKATQHHDLLCRPQMEALTEEVVRALNEAVGSFLGLRQGSLLFWCHQVTVKPLVNAQSEGSVTLMLRASVMGTGTGKAVSILGEVVVSILWEESLTIGFRRYRCCLDGTHWVGF